MAWLRLYDDILDDPKVQMLSDRAFRMFINCLALAKRNNGQLPADINSLAFSLRMAPGKTADTFQALLSAKLIDRNEDGSFTPHNWNGRQYESDSAAERMRRHRANKRDERLRNAQRNSDAIDTDSEVVPLAKANGRAAPSPEDPWVAVYAKGREIFGDGGGAIVTKFKAIFPKPNKVMATLLQCAEAINPTEYAFKILHEKSKPGTHLATGMFP
jgi:hypothetical protein